MYHSLYYMIIIIALSYYALLFIRCYRFSFLIAAIMLRDYHLQLLLYHNDHNHLQLHHYHHRERLSLLYSLLACDDRVAVSFRVDMSRAVLQVFETYQAARTTFVQTVAELAHRPQNIEVTALPAWAMNASLV